MARAREFNIKKIVLESLLAAGSLSLMLLAPNVLGAIAKLQKQKRRYDRRYYVNLIVKELIISNQIEYHENSKGFKVLRLTEKGRQALVKYALKDKVIKAPWHWDRKYRVIIFDIKEFKRSTRNKLRLWLEHLGFVRLQNSVWVHPYECREVVIMLKSHFHIGNEVLYMTVDSIENDKWLRKEFDLPD
ncbi:MAG: CRISPR-associated endonuclease Cas2 [Candidatus Vogelbacteria bacterium CG10_big_fil_rev_8_21_14_0_10_49_38]|uniref:CRISPR-associated endonuclease Cas2 n=1 Tax=Candidatus Vogelbacteria bacterium CG10_big_fil_rev_8_21_14_0_10_49_38 TaxID=1975043 RepID=A0A2H0RHV7_9BACT|nr:MAG: CRISPR-associated endonuclease Cas2 [bacterium CG10_49_38]PIR46083.1 MAG: CRISPR-associated endonuclease Cas2 [Candidatus Vogelbacteria bacterium CG10_big_fil_rev_8_21_14_0_10_49_38]